MPSLTPLPNSPLLPAVVESEMNSNNSDIGRQFDRSLIIACIIGLLYLLKMAIRGLRQLTQLGGRGHLAEWRWDFGDVEHGRGIVVRVVQ
jgi:hypothetical protein